VLHGLVAHGALGPGKNVLDVGCGTGNYIVALVEQTGCRGWGVDPDDAMLAIAQKRTGRLTFTAGNAESLGVPPRSFDLVFSVDVIHNVGNLEAAFHAAALALRRDGKVATTTESKAVIRARVPLTSYFPETAEIDLRRYPSIPEIKASMAATGFVDLYQQTVEFPYELRDFG
jgi:ubiquinone/menaquinone biosynthesis C-methylase UbiE